MKIIIRSVKPTDRDWLGTVLSGQGVEDFASAEVTADSLSASPGFIAQVGEDRLGTICYRIGPRSYDILLLYSGRPGLGIGRALVNSVIMEANDAHCDLVTVVSRGAGGAGVTFFTSLGFKISAVRPTEPAKTTRTYAKKAGDPAVVAPVTADEIELSFTVRR